GAGGGEGRRLVDALAAVSPVDRGRGAEDDALDARVAESAQQGHGLPDVRVVVAERIGHRLRHHDAGRAVHDDVDVRMLGEQPVDDRPVGDVADVQGPPVAEVAAAGGEVVEDDG